MDLLRAFIAAAFSPTADTDNGRALQAFARFMIGAVILVPVAGLTLLVGGLKSAEWFAGDSARAAPPVWTVIVHEAEPAIEPAPVPVPVDVYTAARAEALVRKVGLCVWIDAEPQRGLFPSSVHVRVNGPWYGVQGPAVVISRYVGTPELVFEWMETRQLDKRGVPITTAAPAQSAPMRGGSC